MNRRKFVSGVFVSGVGVGAILDSIFNMSDDLLSGDPSFVRRYTTSELSRSVVTGGPTPDSGPGYYATLIRSSEEAAQTFSPKYLPTGSNDWRNIDYSKYFVACFVSRYPITDDGTAKGDQPLTQIVDEEFRFVLTVPDGGFTSTDSIYTVLEKWERNSSVPESAVVCLNFR